MPKKPFLFIKNTGWSTRSIAPGESLLRHVARGIDNLPVAIAARCICLGVLRNSDTVEGEREILDVGTEGAAAVV